MRAPRWQARVSAPAWMEKLRRCLYPYRPRLKDWRFWAVQVLVLIIAGTHTTAEVMSWLGHPIFLGSSPRIALASMVTVSLFFVPVVYAALNFGFAGAVATAVWCTALTLPNLIWFHDGMEKVREALQIGTVDAIAVFVGQRVEREMAERKRAEAASAALQASEARYRGLFESSPVPIILLDGSGSVLEANPAAGALFKRPAAGLKGAALGTLLSPAAAEHLLNPRPAVERNHEDTRLSLETDGARLYLEPSLTPIEDAEGVSGWQVLLRDVTEEQRRQAGLRAYAAYMLRAQEEERKRIAQELHDDTVQALILLCRRLDNVESAGEPLPALAVDELRAARRSAEHVVQGLREFAKALRPPILEDLGLVTAVRRLLADFAERSHTEERLRVQGEERRLAADTELGIFRIAQESLRNVERHAKATHVSVAMAFNRRNLRLEIVDNGVGFVPPTDPGSLASGGCLGLLGMKERAELLGGTLELQSAPGKGTRVTATIPVHERHVAGEQLASR